MTPTAATPTKKSAPKAKSDVSELVKPPIGQQSNVGGSAAGNSLMGWGAFIDSRETTPELQWPLSIQTYDLMFNDAQVRGLLLSMVLPITRYKWSLDPGDASPATAQRIADDLGLPILGQKPIRRKRNANRFQFRKHLELVLTTALKYGHLYAEQVCEFDAAGDVRLRKLAPIMPDTITNINVEPDGGLRSVEQPGNVDQPQTVNEIKISRLVAYIWDQYPGNWVGRSMLRSMYKAWLIKDRVIRVGAINIERGGNSAPIFEAPPGASDEAIQAIAAMAQAVKAGEAAGGAVPYGTKQMNTASGQSSAAADYVRLMNEEMARSSLQMFMQLGQTQSGSRSMFEAGVDYFSLAQQSVAQWFKEIQDDHIIEDLVDWNEGVDAAAPSIVFEPANDPSTSVEDLERMVTSGLITVGPEIEEWLRDMKRMPAKPEQETIAPAGQPFGYDLDNGIITIDERRAQLGLPPKDDPAIGSMTVPEYLKEFGATAASPVTNDPAPAPPDSGSPATTDGVPSEGSPVASLGRNRAREYADPTGPIARLVRLLWASDDQIRLPDRELRRQPYKQEVLAKVDYKAMDEEFNAHLDKALESWKDVKAKQIDQLHDAIIAADGDLTVIASIEADALGADGLLGHMESMASKSADLAIEEAKAQKVTIGKPKLDKALISDRADAVADLMSRSISEAAARHAVNRTNAAGSLTPAEVAATVKDYLHGLSDSYVKDQLSGAITQAQNYARFEVMNNGPAATIYSSELLDSATCSPCSDVDGTEYGSIDEAQQDYPTGGYMECDGGVRCRGTLIAVYSEETGAKK